MPFDGEPEIRRLMWHPESGCLYIERCKSQYEEALDIGVSDVTDIPEYEERYKNMLKMPRQP